MPSLPLFRLAPALLLIGLAGPVSAQAPIAFGGVKADISAPVEVAAEALSVDQATGKAVFSGNVQISQGEMRLSAATVTVTYAGGDRRRISSLEAEGQVTLVSGPDAAEAARASYDVEAGRVVLTGDVLISQGQNVLTGQVVTVDLETGSAQVEGRVRSILQPAGR